MAEYIEREAASRVLCDACGNAACPKGLIPRCSYYEKMQSIPAADVRPVVLCKDCAIPHNNWTGCPKLNGTRVCDEDFCSHGIKSGIKSVCDGCKTCEYFHDEHWNCQGEKEICTHYTANFCPNCGADMRET